jgi:hypothetical protein
MDHSDSTNKKGRMHMSSLSRRNFVRASAIPLALLAVTGCQAAPPAPTPEPLPPGASKLFLTVDMVQSTKNLPADQAVAKGCVMTNRFPRNGEIVWRAKIYDGKSGDSMDDKGVNKASVTLANGVAVDMKYGGHPGKQPVDYYWTGSWPVPTDQPTGTLNFSIAATAPDGRTGSFKPLAVAASLLTITEETLATIPTPVAAAAPAAPAASPTK